MSLSIYMYLLGFNPLQLFSLQKLRSSLSLVCRSPFRFICESISCEPISLWLFPFYLIFQDVSGSTGMSLSHLRPESTCFPISPCFLQKKICFQNPGLGVGCFLLLSLFLNFLVDRNKTEIKYIWGLNCFFLSKFLEHSTLCNLSYFKSECCSTSRIQFSRSQGMIKLECVMITHLLYPISC